jgi:hypothetical protein
MEGRFCLFAVPSLENLKKPGDLAKPNRPAQEHKKEGCQQEAYHENMGDGTPSQYY